MTIFVSVQKNLLHGAMNQFAKSDQSSKRKNRDLFVQMIIASLNCEYLRIWAGTVLSSGDSIIVLLNNHQHVYRIVATLTQNQQFPSC